MLARLRSSAEFGRVKREGVYWGGKRCSINVARQPVDRERVSGEPGCEMSTRVGYITSKRIGGAVQRNRARRLIRESMRFLERSIQPNWDIVVIAQPAISKPGVRMQDVRDELQWLLKKANLMTSS
ncbi:MAG: ribonuclease P protein component [Chloroflexi bacterium]|nr:ribonuclease P protein component [Chloroflexota bacterium]